MSEKPIECREMLKHEPGMVEDISHMAIPHLVETGLRSGLLSEGYPYLRLVTQNLEESNVARRITPVSAIPHLAQRKRGSRSVT